jgi:hypothetical protein
MWCFCGQFVVNCVVNVDSGWSLFGELKFGTFLKFIFAPVRMAKLLVLFLRRRRGGQVRVISVNHRLPLTVCLLFPDLYEFAVLRQGLALGVFQGDRVGTNQIGEIAGTRDLHLVYAPGHGGVWTEN